jgi:integrase
VRRRIYEDKADTTKTRKSAGDLPIPDALRSRLFSVSGREWIFESPNSTPTPVNPGNALKRYIRPAVRSLGIKIGGWHDFRNTLGTTLRKHGWSAKVREDILGPCRLQTVCTTTQTMTIFAMRSAELHLSFYEMLRNRELQIRKILKTKDLVPAVGLEPTT